MIMNGEGWDFSKYSAVASSRIEGANGRNGSRCLIRLLRVSFISGRRGSTTILRLPNARGPPLHPPLEPADHLSVSNVLCCLAAQLLFWDLTVAQASLFEDLLDGCSGETGPPVGMVHHE